MKNLGIILIFFCSLPLYAQDYNIKGNITDEHKEPLANVTVTLSGIDSVFIKGLVTDSVGQYLLSGVKNGVYIFTAKYMGFDSYSCKVELEGKDLYMHDIILKPSNFNLNEVEVKGKSFIRKKDHVLIIPGKQQAKHASTGYDLLDNLMIPGLNVNRKNGEVKNFNGIVSMYINGQRADFREVRTLRPRDIEKIEYYDVPTGIYSNDVAVINYITKEYKTGGYISLDGRQAIGYMNGDYNAAAKINSGNTTYKFFGGHTMKKTNNTTEVHEDFNFDNYNFTRDKYGFDALNETNGQYVRFDIMNSNQKRTLSGKFTFAHNHTPVSFSKENISYGGVYAGRESLSYTENCQRGWMPNLDLIGNFKIKTNQSFIAYLNCSYSRNDYNRSYQESEFKSVTDVDEDFYKGLASLLYNIGMKHNNSLTIQLNHLYQNSKSIYTGDYNDRQQLWSAESFFYVNYNQRINPKLSLYAHAGFSSLQYKLLGKERVNRIGPRLNGRLMIQPKPNQFLQISFDVTSTYPTLDRLNDVEQDIDPFIIKRGNSDMDNSIFYQGNAGYNAQFGPVNIMVAAFCFYSQNTVAEHYYEDHNKLISSYSSDAGFLLSNLMTEITWKITNSLNVKAKGQWVYDKISKLINKHHSSFLGGVVMDYYLKDWKFNLFANLPYKIVDTSLLRKEIEYKTNYGASIGWNRGGWFAEIGTNNPLSKKWPVTTDLNACIYNYKYAYHDESLQQTGYVKISYTFDFGIKTDRDKNDTNTTINSAILKAY